MTGPDADFSFRYWCGCEGVDPPDLYSLCADDVQVTDPEMEAPGYNGLTCGAAVEYIRAVSSETMCEEEVADIRAICGCEAAPIEDATVLTFFVSMTTSALFIMGILVTLLAYM